MQSLAEDTFRFDSPEQRGAKSQAPALQRLRAQGFADRAAAAGFILSMLFLTGTAIYALSLSGSAKLVLAEAFALADRAAYDAGFRLEELAMSGNRITPQTEVLTALQLPYKGSSLFYSANGARSRLLDLGWIETAEVRRVLPSRLEVVIAERIPFARWENAAGQLFVIDRAGRLLGGDEDGRFKELPLFAGVGANALAADFGEALKGREALRGRIQRIELIVERFWAVKLGNGLLLKLPRKLTPLVLSRLDSLLASQRISELALESIDLRLMNRTILQLLEPTVENRDKAIAALNSAPYQAWPPGRKGKAL